MSLGDILPWTELEEEYNSRLDNQKKGAVNKLARMILGAMIIKHKKAKKKGKMMLDTIAMMLNYLHKDISILVELLAKNKLYCESLLMDLNVLLRQKRDEVLELRLVCQEVLLVR